MSKAKYLMTALTLGNRNGSPPVERSASNWRKRSPIRTRRWSSHRGTTKAKALADEGAQPPAASPPAMRRSRRQAAGH